MHIYATPTPHFKFKSITEILTPLQKREISDLARFNGVVGLRR